MAMDRTQGELQLTPPAARFGKRHIQVAIASISSFLIYGLRINLSVAIVAMTGQGLSGSVTVPVNISDSFTSGTGLANHTEDANGTDTFHVNDGYQPSVSPPGEPYPSPVYDWDEQTQGLILSSFFWGYLVTQVPAGILTQRYGGHRFLSWALLSTSTLTALLPPCAYLGGWWFVCINRMLQGVTQGFVYPSIFTLMGLWVPSPERGFLAGMILSAQNVGPVVATPVAGFLAAYAGWPSIFYWFGAVGFAVGLMVLFLGADSPAAHKTISAEERNYIEHSLGGAKEQFPIPWRSIGKSEPVWAAIITLSAHGGVFLTFLTKIPSYLNSVLKFDIKDNGLLSALPYLASWFMAYVFSATCDFMVGRGWLNMTQARKVFNSVAHVGPAISMIILGYCTDPAVCVALLTICVSLMAASYQGVQSNFMDLAPNFSGTIFSMANFSAAVIGVFGPIAVGLIVTEPGSVNQWRLVYFLLAGVMFLSNLVFVGYGTADVQPWNFPLKKKKIPQISDERRSSRPLDEVTT